MFNHKGLAKDYLG